MVDRMSELFGYPDTDNLVPKKATIKSMGKQNRNSPSPSSSPKELSKSDKAKSEGLSERKKYRNYYDVNDTITTAQTTDPHDEDNPNYNRERIFEVLERNAEVICVTNDGADTLYVIVSHEGGQNFARERPIYAGEHKTFFNVYELRLRSPTQGLAYRVTEYPICCIRSTVTGVVTANAGTNLNTSALSTESTLSALILAINELNVRLRELAATQPFLDTSGRTRANIETGTLVSLTTLGSIGSTSGTTTTNAQYSAAQFNWELADIAIATSLRANILTS